MRNSGVGFPEYSQKAWQRNSATGRLERIDSTDVASGAQTAPDDLQGSWLSYTVKKVKDVVPFFGRRIRNFAVGSAHGLVSLSLAVLGCGAALKLSGRKPVDPYSGDESTSSAVIGGIAEEIFYRGVMQNGIYSVSSFVFNKLNINNHENKAFWTAIIPTAFTFGLYHLILPNPSLEHVAHCIARGFHFGYLSHNYGLETAIWAHASNNFAVGILVNNIQL